eukprot:Sspe_Gene.108976::Locus_88248_Transcript_1_1_Confidence_1.000_Length_394::g.108976::m.108976
MAKCKEWFTNALRFLHREGETEDERIRKHLLVVGLVPVTVIVLSTALFGSYPATRYFYAAVAAYCTAALIYVAATKTCTLQFMQGTVLFITLFLIFVRDFMTYGSQDRWS